MIEWQWTNSPVVELEPHYRPEIWRFVGTHYNDYHVRDWRELERRKAEAKYWSESIEEQADQRLIEELKVDRNETMTRFLLFFNRKTNSTGPK